MINSDNVRSALLNPCPKLDMKMCGVSFCFGLGDYYCDFNYEDGTIVTGVRAPVTGIKCRLLQEIYLDNDGFYYCTHPALKREGRYKV
jgi:hypothetical protein